MKKEIDILDATPSKRLFLSIIADYDLNKSMCELIDNAIDVWVKNGRSKKIEINITLNKIQQIILVEDNAGGIIKEELKYIVGPGQTSINVSVETIGIFGVGTKRAVVALSQDVKIITRYQNDKTHQVEFDDGWLENEDWHLPVYETDDISEGTTIVELKRLRIQISDESIAQLKYHLSITYAKFLVNDSISIIVNGDNIKSMFFENWAFPPDYPPHKYIGVLHSEDGYDIRINAVAGLTRESSPAAGEYGVYFYCNDRLIVHALKSFDVGFTRGIAGLPHPKVSLTRVIVCLNGDARGMPWNSSKSDINTKHNVFIAIHQWLISVVKDYASLSRIWMGEWPDKVFKYTSGDIKEIQIDNFPEVRKSYLPPMPRSLLRFGDRVSHINKAIIKKKPWAKGLYEGIVAADLIFKQRFEQRNRIALIVLDSTLEIAFKEYLVNDSGTAYSDQRLSAIFNDRNQVHNEIKKYVRISGDQLKNINFFYRLRCKLIHERASVNISDDQIESYRKVVELMLNKLFKLKFNT